jgi:hypothetical protein
MAGADYNDIELFREGHWLACGLNARTTGESILARRGKLP